MIRDGRNEVREITDRHFFLPHKLRNKLFCFLLSQFFIFMSIEICELFHHGFDDLSVDFLIIIEV